VLQKWVRFRCESLARYADDLYDLRQSLNPDVCVIFNIKGVYSFTATGSTPSIIRCYANP